MRVIRFPTFLLLLALLFSVLLLSNESENRIEGVPLPVYPVEVSTSGTSGDLWFCVGPTQELDGVDERKITLTSFSASDSYGRVTIADELGNDIEREIFLEAGKNFDIKPEQSAPGARWAAVTIEVPKGEVIVKQQITGTGIDSKPCVTATSDSWYLPWSSTSRPGNKASLLFYNPFQAPAVADLHFVGDVGRRETLDSQGVVIPSRSMLIYDLTSRIADSSVVSATVDVRVGQLVVARFQTMEEDGQKGLDLAYGSTRAAKRVFLTGFETGANGKEFVSILNPNNDLVEVEVSYFALNGQNIQPRKLELRALQRQVLELDMPESVGGPYGIEVNSFDGEPITAAFVSFIDNNSSDDQNTIGLATENGVDIAAREWKILIPDDSPQSRYLSIFNPNAESIASVRFLNHHSELPISLPAQIELDGLEGVSLKLADKTFGLFDVESTAPIVARVTVNDAAGMYVENGVAISKTSEIPIP